MNFAGPLCNPVNAKVVNERKEVSCLNVAIQYLLLLL